LRWNAVADWFQVDPDWDQSPEVQAKNRRLRAIAKQIEFERKMREEEEAAEAAEAAEIASMELYEMENDEEAVEDDPVLEHTDKGEEPDNTEAHLSGNGMVAVVSGPVVDPEDQQAGGAIA